MSSEKMHQSEMLLIHRFKRFWTKVEPLKRDYPDFDDDREGEEYYRNQFRKIILPNIRNFTVKFTFTTRSTTTKTRGTTKKITLPTTRITQLTIKKFQNVTAKKIELEAKNKKGNE